MQLLQNWWCLKVVQFVWICLGWVRLGGFIGSVFGKFSERMVKSIGGGFLISPDLNVLRTAEAKGTSVETCQDLN